MYGVNHLLPLFLFECLDSRERQLQRNFRNYLALLFVAQLLINLIHNSIYLTHVIFADKLWRKVRFLFAQLSLIVLNY